MKAIQGYESSGDEQVPNKDVIDNNGHSKQL